MQKHRRNSSHSFARVPYFIKKKKMSRIRPRQDQEKTNPSTSHAISNCELDNMTRSDARLSPRHILERHGARVRETSPDSRAYNGEKGDILDGPSDGPLLMITPSNINIRMGVDSVFASMISHVGSARTSPYIAERHRRKVTLPPISTLLKPRTTPAATGQAQEMSWTQC